MLKIALFEPQIPQNTGNIARIAAGIGCELILIGKLGFSLDDKYLKRAGLDYWEHVNLNHIPETDRFFERYADNFLAFVTKFGTIRYDNIFEKSENKTQKTVIVFGNETTGLPDYVHGRYRDQRFYIPMNKNIRSINLSNSVAIVVYEYLKRTEFKNI